MPRASPSEQLDGVLSNRWLSLFGLAGILVGAIFLVLYKLAYTGNAFCVLSFHVHHLEIGIGVMVLGLVVFPFPKYRHWSMFLVAFGATAFLGGLVDYLIGQPLPLYC